MDNLLVESALRSLVMASLVWIGLRVFRVRHVLAQKIAWTMVLAAAIAMPFSMRFVLPNGGLSWDLPAGRLLSAIEPFPAARPALAAQPGAAAAAQNANQDAIRDSTESVALYGTAAVYIPQEASGVMPSAAAMHSRFSVLRSLVFWRELCEAIYEVVCGLLLLRLLLGLASADRIRRAARPAPGLMAFGNVRISPSIASPITIGSTILLPSAYAEWDLAKLRAVLAHERSHVSHGDFYLQLLARVYTAFIWLSPLGWWLQRTLSDLGEAWSDRSALEEVADRPSYAEMLLEFAAIPHTPPVGVSIARASNLPRRIDRLLNDAHFRSAFLRGRSRVWLAALFVLLAMAAATTRLRVEAAEAPESLAPPELLPAAAPPPATASALSDAESAPAAPQVKPVPAAPAITTAPAVTQDAPSPLSGVAPVPAGSLATGDPQPLPSPSPIAAGETQAAPDPSPQSSSPPTEPFAVVDGASGLVTGYGALGDDFERVHNSQQGDYVWLRHNGKSYVIDDPETVVRARRLLQPSLEMSLQKHMLDEEQRAMAKELVHPIHIDTTIFVKQPDLSGVNARLQAQMQQLQQDKDLSPELRRKIQTQLQAAIARMQAEANDRQKQDETRQAIFAKRSATLQQRQVDLGKTLADLAAKQASAAQSSRGRVQDFLDQAVRDGKAKPVN